MLRIKLIIENCDSVVQVVLVNFAFAVITIFVVNVIEARNLSRSGGLYIKYNVIGSGVWTLADKSKLPSNRFIELATVLKPPTLVPIEHGGVVSRNWIH